MAKYFIIKDGCLCLEFDGTEDGLRQKFYKDKENAKISFQERIKKFQEKKELVKRPENYSTLTESERKALDADINAKILSEDAHIEKTQAMIREIDNMKISDL